MTKEKYNNVKTFYQTLTLKDLGELNKIFNFRGTVLLCQIFEQCSGQLQNLFKFNLENVTLQVLSASVSTETKTNV